MNAPHHTAQPQAADPAGRWTCYQADALQTLAALPARCADALVTDPPYSSGGLHLAARQAPPRVKYIREPSRHRYEEFAGDNRDQRSWYRWCLAWLQEAYRCLAPPGYVLMFSDWRQLPTATDVLQGAGFTWRGTIAWDKTEGARAPNAAYFRHQAEFVVWGTRTTPSRDPSSRRGPWPGVYRHPVKPAEKRHPTAKPIELMRRLVEAACKPGGTVLDPFMGSGTTGLAAVESGRKFIGVETEPHYFDVATDLLKGTNQDGTPLSAA